MDSKSKLRIFAIVGAMPVLVSVILISAAFSRPLFQPFSQAPADKRPTPIDGRVVVLKLVRPDGAVTLVGQKNGLTIKIEFDGKTYSLKPRINDDDQTVAVTISQIERDQRLDGAVEQAEETSRELETVQLDTEMAQRSASASFPFTMQLDRIRPANQKRPNSLESPW